MFERRSARSSIRPTAASADAMFEAAIEAGADDVESDAERPRGHLRARGFRRACATRWRAKFGPAEQARLPWRPQNTVPVDERDGGDACSSCSRRSTTTTTCRTSTPISRCPTTIAAPKLDRRERDAMRILGLDPGLRHTGWGVIESQGNRLVHRRRRRRRMPTPTAPLAERLVAASRRPRAR